MKLKSLILLPCLLLLANGCNTTQQTNIYNSLQTIETTADTSYQTYIGLVVTGKIPTNSVPQVSRAYNDLHAAIATAAVLDQSGTNAFTITNVTSELSSFVTLVTTITSKAAK